jgi:hypothetical protein
MASKWLAQAEAAVSARFLSPERANSAKCANRSTEADDRGAIGTNGTIGTAEERNENATPTDPPLERKAEIAFSCANSAEGAESFPASEAVVDAWTDDHAERAAIVEEGTGGPREWCEALARLDATRPPGDVPVARWRAFIDDAGRFIDGGWCARAIALGWTPQQLFGCDRHRPFARIDHAGLVWSLNGRKLIALADATAVMEAAPDIRQTYRRLPAEQGGGVLPWQLIPESRHQ